MPTIERYSSELQMQWDALVNNSRNATFLLKRDYMDYHSDRFEDFSLVARNDRGEVVALLPANREGDTLISHRGLTYGGWILPERRCDAIEMLDIWQEMTNFLKIEGFKKLIYKPIPHIYHAYPAEEDLYAIFRFGGQISTTLISSVVDLNSPLPFGRRFGQIARKSINSGLTFGESDKWEEYWQLLNESLKTRHDTKPVHSLSEIKLLKQRFPNEIKLYTAERDGITAAGIVLYCSSQVIHMQYSATSATGMNEDATAGLYKWVIDHFSGKARWFDFGTSNEQNGKYLNRGLIQIKNSSGGRAVVYNTFTIEL